jgi:hypothetical protein
MELSAMSNTVTWSTLWPLIAALVAWGGIVGYIVWRACAVLREIEVRLTVLETRNRQDVLK